MADREQEVRRGARAIFARERLSSLVLGGPVLALLFAAGWGFLGEASPDTWSVGMILAGFFAGGVVRLLGLGTRPIFYVASIFLYFLTVFLAVGLFDVMSDAVVLTRVLIVVGAIGASAALGLVSFGLRQEERWVLRDNRGFAKPEKPEGLLGGFALPFGVLVGSSVLAAAVGVGILSGSAAHEEDDFPIFGEPTVEYWEKALRREPDLAEEARRNGVGLGLDGSDDACREAVDVRQAECEFNLCRAEEPFVLAGCLETAKAVRDDTPIRW